MEIRIIYFNINKFDSWSQLHLFYCAQALTKKINAFDGEDLSFNRAKITNHKRQCVSKIFVLNSMIRYKQKQKLKTNYQSTVWMIKVTELNTVNLKFSKEKNVTICNIHMRILG